MVESTTPSIQVVVVGYPRAPSLSLPTLYLSLKAAAASLGDVVGFEYHLIHDSRNFTDIQRAIDYIGTLEGPPLSFTLHEDSSENLGTLLEENLAHSLPNPYSGRPMQSVSNHIRLLKVMQSVKHRCVSDIIIFVRADMVPVGDINLSQYKTSSRENILTPAWHKWGGVNDRFAILPNAYADHYLSRFSSVPTKLSRGEQIHGEEHLYQSLIGTPLRQCVTAKFARTTSSHSLREEDFEATRRVSSIIKRAIRSRLAKVSSPRDGPDVTSSSFLSAMLKNFN